jgi:polysaccharide export outer membrane protein
MKDRIGIVCILLLLSGAVGLEAQEPAQIQAEIQGKIQAHEAGRGTSEPSLKPNPLETLRNFEPAADEEYRLGKGDEIIVDFPGRPEMQAKVVIGPDGRISLPLAGEVKLGELTRSEAAKTVQSALATYYSNLSVQISVSKYTANRVLLLGSVDHPGMLTFDGTPTLLETLARGGVETGPSFNGQTHGTNQIPERCAIYRGSDQVVWVELKALIESGNSLADLRLRRDDVVYVPNAAERFVSVLGEVQHPGAVPLVHNSTLASVLAGAGGITEKAGNTPRIQIVDPTSGTSRTVTFKDVLDPIKSLEVTLRPGEIVYVPRSGFARVTYYIERLNPLINVMSIAAYAGIL